MGAAFFLGMVIVALALIGLIVYALCLGIVSLISRLWRHGQPRLEPLLAEVALGTAIPEPTNRDWLWSQAPYRPPEAGEHCWEAKGCPTDVRQTCAAFMHPEKPCWMAVMEGQRELKPECLACRQFNLPLFMMQG